MRMLNNIFAWSLILHIDFKLQNISFNTSNEYNIRGNCWRLNFLTRRNLAQEHIDYYYYNEMLLYLAVIVTIL